MDTINRVENDEWFNNWYGQDPWAGMSQLAIDPYHYLNAYSANLWIDGINANGRAYLGQYYNASDYRQSISLAYQIVQYTMIPQPMRLGTTWDYLIHFKIIVLR